MMELKFGHPVLVWISESNKAKGRYIRNDMTGFLPHHVLLDDGDVEHFKHAQLDPEGTPISGDMVEVSNDGELWDEAIETYIGMYNDGVHVTEHPDGYIHRWPYVRYPRKSKRDRVKEAIRSWQESSKVPMYDDLADEIDKIYTEDT